MTDVTRYPLCWPPGWPRTPAHQRRPGRFAYDSRTYPKGLSIYQATQRVLRQLDVFGAREINISSNLRLRKDGLPVSDQSHPNDPGVAVYFELRKKQQCVSCDTYTRVEQNLAGVAASIEALRALERHGSGIVERAFRGFEAIPHLPAMAEEPWYETLGVGVDDSFELVKQQYLTLRSHYHPDHGGDAEKFDQLIKAWDAALAAHAKNGEQGR